MTTTRAETSFSTTPTHSTLSDAVDTLASRRSPVSKETLLKEYEFLRAEVNSTLAAQLQILSFGTATLGLVAGAAFVGSTGSFRSDVLVLFLPLLAYLTLTIWFSEVMRMLRAGSFLLTVEKQIDDLGDGSLAWESHVWVGRLKYAVAPDGNLRHSLIRPYYSIFDPDQLRLFSVSILFLTIAGSSIAMGWPDASWPQRGFALVAGTIAVVVLVLLYHLRLAQVADLFEALERPKLTERLTTLATKLARDAS